MSATPTSPERPAGRPGTSRPGARRVTVADVAREAGVSRATVSYVLSQKPDHRIPEATAERVRTAAARLGYRPSVAARALKLGRSDTVLALMPNWPVGHTQARVFELLASDLEEAGLTLMICPATGSRTRWSPDAWRGVTPVAVVTFELMPPAEVAELAEEGVIVEQWFGPASADDDREGRPFSSIGQLQVAHLAERGHRRLGYAYPADDRVHAFAEARLRGVREECEARGLEPPVVHPVALVGDSARLAVQGWRAAGVTAVAAYNDDVALSVTGAAHDLAVGVPDALAVIGVENTPAGACARPALSTIDIDNTPRARYVVASLLAQLHGGPPPATALAPHHAVIARSTS